MSSSQNRPRVQDRQLHRKGGSAPYWMLLLAVLSLSSLAVAQGSQDTVGTELALSLPLLLVALAALIAFDFLLVASETSIELLRPHHARNIKDESPVLAGRLQMILEERQKYVSSCSIAVQLTRLVIVFLVLLAQPTVAPLVGLSNTWQDYVLSTALSMLPLGVLHVVVAQLMPSAYSRLYPAKVAGRLFSFIRIVHLVFGFIAAALTAIANLITKRFGGQASLSNINAAEEEILSIVDTAQETGEIDQEERKLLRSVFSFTDTVAREIMTPRVDLEAMPIKSEPGQLVEIIQKSGHSRIPLYEETDDQIVGIIHAKDLFASMLAGQSKSLRTLMRPALFVPENKNLFELLSEMRLHRTQLAIIQDEFGGTAGIVSIEDIVEELVGEIVDEYDVEEPDVVEADGHWNVNGKIHVDDVNEAIGSEFSSEEFDTIGGYVFGLFGRQPTRLETIKDGDYLFTVLDTDGRRIIGLQIERTFELLDNGVAEPQESASN